MTQLQQVRQEIERLKNDYLNRSYTFVPTAMNQLLEFLDTLSEEPDNSLEEEIDRFENWMETYNQSDYPTSFTTRDIARHFAEWQKQQMLKEKEALLEWANKRLEEFRHIAEISNDVAADGEVDAFEELIEKLNEM